MHSFLAMIEPSRALQKPSVLCVARYVVKRLGGSVVQIKLHKLLYYCQAASLVWHDKTLFDAPIQAWANGPVVTEVWAANRYRGVVSLSDLADDGTSLDKLDKNCVESIIKAYGDLSGYELSAQTHNEKPWIDARKGLKSGEQGRNQIEPDAIRDYYRKVWTN